MTTFFTMAEKQAVREQGIPFYVSREISNENSFTPVRILSSWNQNMSIFYATIADIRSLKNKIDNVSKIGKILSTLVSKWNNESSKLLYILFF